VPAPRRLAQARRPGRPPKFGRPGQVVAVTLPADAVRDLQKINQDLAWAILALLDKHPRAPTAAPTPHAQLVTIAGQHSLIVVNRAELRALPGIDLIPLDGSRAFLALEPGRGMADLEVAVLDRLQMRGGSERERHALTDLLKELRAWRRSGLFQFHTRAIIVVERVKPGRRRARARDV
jgi:hypothetical protein